MLSNLFGQFGALRALKQLTQRIADSVHALSFGRQVVEADLRRGIRDPGLIVFHSDSTESADQILAIVLEQFTEDNVGNAGSRGHDYGSRDAGKDDTQYVLHRGSLPWCGFDRIRSHGRLAIHDRSRLDGRRGYRGGTWNERDWSGVDFGHQVAPAT